MVRRALTVDDQDFASELRGDGEPMNVKNSGWMQAVVVGVAVGVIVSASNLFMSRSVGRDDHTADTLVELKTKVEYLAAQVNKLAEKPYVGRDEYQSRIQAVEDRVSGLEKRADNWQQRPRP